MLIGLASQPNLEKFAISLSIPGWLSIVCKPQRKVGGVLQRIPQIAVQHIKESAKGFRPNGGDRIFADPVGFPPTNDDSFYSILGSDPTTIGSERRPSSRGEDAAVSTIPLEPQRTQRKPGRPSTSSRNASNTFRAT